MAQVSRLELKVNKCMESKEFYEAQQVYRTLYYRMKSQSRHSELISILYGGAMKLFTENQYSSGADLADLFADVVCVSSPEPTAELFERIEHLLNCICAELPESSAVTPKAQQDAKNKFLTDLIKWSQGVTKKNRERRRGLSALHAIFGSVLWKHEDFGTARMHWLLAEKPEEFANFLIDLQQKQGETYEIDLFVALAVFQLLCLHRVKTASTLLQCYAANHPTLKLKEAPYKLPLLNFCWLLTQACTRRNLSTFSLLVEKYDKDLSRDVMFKAYLDKIGQLFFGLPPPRTGGPMGGLLGGMFKGLLGDDKKEEKEEFSDSDMEVDDNVDMEEDGYETAEEDGPTGSSVSAGAAPTKSSQPSGSSTAQSNKSKVDQMDDLD